MVVASIVGLIAWSLSGTTAYYRTPAELLSATHNPTERVRLAGKVVPGSVERDGPITTFEVTDGEAQIAVRTDAVLPDTFTAGVEVVAEGSMTANGTLAASTVLAKCPSKFKAKVATGP